MNVSDASVHDELTAGVNAKAISANPPATSVSFRSRSKASVKRATSGPMSGSDTAPI